jgi:D-glycero-D-manno-heptose 1,7-bisphosphate phosphatase
VFLDLNGTLVVPLLVERPVEYRLIAGAGEALALLGSAGFVCPVVTVQSRIEKGVYSEADFRRWFDSLQATLAETGAFVAGPYVCPHRIKTRCTCKKPDGRLYRRAAAELGIDLGTSFVVGDTGEDLQAARLLGCAGILVRTGWPVTAEVEALADHVADGVLEAARWILGKEALRFVAAVE